MTFRSTLRATAAALLLLAGAAQASSVIMTRGATTAKYNDANSTITATQSADAVVTVRVRGTDGADFTVSIAPPRNDRLRRGTYDYTEGSVLRTGRAAGAEGTWRGGRCTDETYGGFDLRQIAFDAQGKVTTLDATIVYACGEGGEPVEAKVKYLAVPLYFWFHSEWGSYVGELDNAVRGRDRENTFQPDTSDIQMRGEPDYYAFNYYVEGKSESWSITVWEIPGVPLVPGTYATKEWDSWDVTHVAMDISANHRACSRNTGVLVVHDIRHDSRGRVVALNADFQFNCDNRGPLVWGTIRHLL